MGGPSNPAAGFQTQSSGGQALAARSVPKGIHDEDRHRTEESARISSSSQPLVDFSRIESKEDRAENAASLFGQALSLAPAFLFAEK